MTDSVSLLFATAEVAPYAKVGGLADVAGALPVELSRLGVTATVISPFYAMVRKHSPEIPTLTITGTVKLEDDTFPYKIREIRENSVCFWFVENNRFYDRAGIYTDSRGQGYSDNNARYFFFQYVILDLLQKRILTPDVLHINDHHTALLPLMIRERTLEIPTLLTIHNAMYQGQFSSGERLLLQAPEKNYFRHHDCNALKTGIRLADRVVTVSPTYRDELLSNPDLAYGLRTELLAKGAAFSGILNGADYDYWNPEKDDFIPRQYSLETIRDKSVNKKTLLQKLHLRGSVNTPLFGSVSRQVESKGFHLILEGINELVSRNACLVFLGTGDPAIMSALEQEAKRYPESVAYIQAYDEPLAHLIEAGADYFLMPSRYEPCGLNQIYSLRYGTIPIVHKTGGLADTVLNWDGKTGNGFSFEPYEPEAFLAAIRNALAVYGTKDWNVLRRNAMLSNYSWQKSAEKYRSLYIAMRSQYE